MSEWAFLLFRMIQQAFIDMENMFELLDVGEEVGSLTLSMTNQQNDMYTQLNLISLGCALHG